MADRLRRRGHECIPHLLDSLGGGKGIVAIAMPSLSNGAPIFAVTDLPKAVDFYTHKLGFKVSMQSSIPFPYAIVTREGIDVHLMIDDSRRGKGAMYAITDDVDALYEELKSHEVRIVEPPEDREYGMRDLYFNDCCGNMIGYGEPLKRD